MLPRDVRVDLMKMRVRIQNVIEDKKNILLIGIAIIKGVWIYIKGRNLKIKYTPFLYHESKYKIFYKFTGKIGILKLTQIDWKIITHIWVKFGLGVPIAVQF